MFPMHDLKVRITARPAFAQPRGRQACLRASVRIAAPEKAARDPTLPPDACCLERCSSETRT